MNECIITDSYNHHIAVTCTKELINAFCSTKLNEQEQSQAIISLFYNISICLCGC